MGFGSLLLFAVTTAVLQKEAIVRGSCAEDEPPLATLAAGSRVQVRSALSMGGGTCYRIAGEVDGKPVEGYLPGSSLTGLDSFDQARRAAGDIGLSRSASERVKQLTASVKKLQGRAHPASKAADLIESNQPGEALRMIENELRRSPQDPYLLAVAGLAYYRMDNLDQAILQWKEALAIEGNPSLEAMLRRAEQEKAADGGSERMVGNRIVLRHERSQVPGPLARAMLEALDEEYSRISNQLGCRASEKMTAVVTSRDTFLRSTNAAEWSGGQYDGRIHVPVSPSRNIDARTRQTFAHELVHACLSELGRWPAWVQEGLAQKYSGEQIPAGQRARLAARIKAGAIPKPSQLGQNWSMMNSENAQLAYSLALLAAEKMIELTASTGLGNLLRNPGDLPRITEEVEKLMGY
jgi:tetratricopeptide (TPR) repeat protein